jgi:hypothetical protein
LEAHDRTSDNDYRADFLKRQGVNLCFSWRWTLDQREGMTLRGLSFGAKQTLETIKHTNLASSSLYL